MGSRGQREAENAIAACRPFRNSTGSMEGTRGSTRTLGWLEQHTEARRIRDLLSRAVYVVWSYGTPIAFVSEDEEGERTAYYVDESHSVTTSHHQTIARVGMGDYETIGESRPARRPRRPAPYGPGRVVLGHQHGPLVAVALDPPVAAVGPDYGLVTNRRGVQYDPQVERDTSYERDMAEERSSRAVPADSPGYQLGRTEDEQQSTLQRLLDPRYSNPNWTPFADEYGHNLPPGADERDAARVEREGTWTP
jgi:hypothetical protein